MNVHLKLIVSVILLFISSICHGKNRANLSKHIELKFESSLKKILKQKYLRVLTTKNPYDYFIEHGNAKGIQYEMVKEFTKYLNKKYVKKDELQIAFELIPVDFDQLIPMINDNKGDFIAVGMTSTPKRKELVDFTVAYRKVDEVIVTRKSNKLSNWKKEIFHIPRDSSYQKSLKKHISAENIKTINPNFNTADIMEFISLNKFNYTLVNSFWAKTIGRQFNNLKIIKNIPFRKNINISWALKKNNNDLLNELNLFLPKVKKGTLKGNILGYKYFYNIGKITSKNFSYSTSTVSEYDMLFKKYARKYNIDWRLLAALCYQESRFNQNIINKWGAIGLFQIKQKTASEPYIGILKIKGMLNIENNIHAGVKYLAWIKKRYLDNTKFTVIKSSNNSKLRMMMAAYNAGPRRLLQAINKTKLMGLKTNVWFRNVELAMLELGYPEPVLYVSEINKRFVSYKLLGIR